MERLNKLQDLAHQARHDFLAGSGELRGTLGKLAVQTKDFMNAIDAERGGRKIPSEERP
jgi:hypothetical protein